MKKTARTGQDRSILFDNIKGLLIFLVVLGHFLQIELRDHEILFSWLWIVIYSIHMPIFILISGYFSNHQNSDAYGQSLHRLAIEFILGCSIICAVRSLLSGKIVTCNLLSPPLGMWYLMTLFTFRLLSPWIKGIRGNIAVSVIFSLLIGGNNQIGPFLSLSRTICLLPFFLIGMIWLDQEKIQALRSMNLKRKIFLIVLWLCILFAFIIVVKKNNMNYNIVWLKASYQKSDMSLSQGLLSRGVLLLTSACTGAVLLMSIGERKCFLSRWGRNSLPVYLLHLAIFYILKYYSKFIFWDNMWVSAALTLAASIGIVWILSLDIVNKILQKLVNEIEKITWKGNWYEPK